MMWAIIGVIFGLIIRHFIIEPIKVQKIRKEYFEKLKKESLENHSKSEEAEDDT